MRRQDMVGRRRRSWPIRVPEDWRVVRRSGNALYDVVVPLIFLALGLVGVAVVVLVIGLLIGVVPYR